MTKWAAQMANSTELVGEINQNLAGIGYGH
jgi:hypothetical protein